MYATWISYTEYEIYSVTNVGKHSKKKSSCEILFYPLYTMDLVLSEVIR